MKQKQIQCIVVSSQEDENYMLNKINKFLAEILEKKLSQMDLTINQKILVIDEIIKKLK